MILKECASAKSERTHRAGTVQLATAAMGTRFEIFIDDGEAPDVRAVGEAAIAEIERLHRQLSFFASDSLLSHINRTAPLAPVRLDAPTFEMFVSARDVWGASGGAFDVTRGGGMECVVLDRAALTVHFTRPGIAVDLGGIAKGHAVDRAAAILREHGIERALVHGGTSSIAAIGAPRNCIDGWRIALAPSHNHTFTLKDSTLSVSSASLRDHIVDPRTGAFVSRVRVAALLGPTATLGDAWSTATAVLGKRPEALGPEWLTIIE